MGRGKECGRGVKRCWWAETMRELIETVRKNGLMNVLCHWKGAVGVFN